MAAITLLTGGGRSGKSRLAVGLAAASPGPRLFVATCPPIDAELRERIARHQTERAQLGFETREEELDLAGVLRAAPGFRAVVIDCLTLWVSNLLYRAEQTGQPLRVEDIAERALELLRACRDRDGRVILVTNEVGLGIIPENALARRFRDLVGRVNQVVARGADEVTLLVAGLPLHLKVSADGPQEAG